MKYKRPDPTASTESWVSIWLGCMDDTNKWAANRGPKSTLNPDEFNTKPCVRGQDKRVGISLHQEYCGNGYRLRDRYHVYPTFEETVASTYKRTDVTLLGATPNEIRVAVQARRKRNKT